MNKLDFMGLLETKVKVDNVCIISKKINISWQWLFNYDRHYNGRVWVGWNPEVWDISLHHMSAQHITCLARFMEKDITFLVSFVYAHNDAVDRVSLWHDIATISITPMPWCLLGDFNCVTDIGEVRGGREHWTPEMQIFKDRLTSNGLGHVRTMGNLFAWTNCTPQNTILKRLDHMIANQVWFSTHTEGFYLLEIEALWTIVLSCISNLCS